MIYKLLFTLFIIASLLIIVFVTTRFQFAETFKNKTYTKVVDCQGCLDEELKSAGFINVTNKNNWIFPGYYDPFLFKNKEIYWTLKNMQDNIFLVTGDCDQDRPNSLEKILI